jgi:hypothetical protein
MLTRAAQTPHTNREWCRYRGLPKDEALALFAEEVESLREEQQKREQQLDQPPEIRATQTTS